MKHLTVIKGGAEGSPVDSKYKKCRSFTENGDCLDCSGSILSGQTKCEDYECKFKEGMVAGKEDNLFNRINNRFDTMSPKARFVSFFVPLLISYTMCWHWYAPQEVFFTILLVITALRGLYVYK